MATASSLSRFTLRGSRRPLLIAAIVALLAEWTALLAWRSQSYDLEAWLVATAVFALVLGAWARGLRYETPTMAVALASLFLGLAAWTWAGFVGVVVSVAAAVPALVFARRARLLNDRRAERLELLAAGLGAHLADDRLMVGLERPVWKRGSVRLDSIEWWYPESAPAGDSEGRASLLDVVTTRLSGTYEIDWGRPGVGVIRAVDAAAGTAASGSGKAAAGAAVGASSVAGAETVRAASAVSGAAIAPGAAESGARVAPTPVVEGSKVAPATASTKEGQTVTDARGVTAEAGQAEGDGRPNGPVAEL